ncbi:MAG: bifunctional phosphopantothenoylcysteine decarboxylase/phosphopantothenate--cysteine ligase CoaBC [Rhodoluna sp.]|nr:bifunctional phosphopantothenoylcysteine decarboxylase/phosphopantothenate--cysteine ligase CoaBC [Rhodoluna sp.]
MHILVGVTGGIAAYKAAGVIRGFTELGHTVKVLPTQNALRFIGATTLEALSHNVVDSDLYTDVDSVKHIALAQEADLIVVAPATAAFIARYANGVADDLLLNVLLATKAKVVVAPAMHTEMWQHPATVANIETLKSRGVKIIEPATGRLTGDDSGPGRLPEPDEIVASALSSVHAQDLSGKTVTIAAGGTREPIDTVRFIGNRSSGKQGIALADAALARGAKVNLIAINIDIDLSRFANVTRVSATAELSTVLDQMLPVSDVIYMPAAVSDYRVANIEPGKLSRHDASELELKLIANPDLLSGLSEKRNALGLKAILVGFAAEVLSSSGNADELKSKANAKLHKKNVELIVANDVSNGAVFDQDSNQVLVVSSSSSIEIQGSKLEVANQIIDETIKLIG